MGWGDEIMAGGRAREAQKTDPRPVVFLDAKGRIRKHEAWKYNPRVAMPDRLSDAHQTIVDGPRARPYVDTVDKTKWRFRYGKHTRGEFYLAPGYAPEIPGDYWIVAPMVKIPGGNKDWGWERFRATVAACPGRLWVHVGPDGERPIPGARRVITRSFWQAAYWTAHAVGALIPEGGLHHLAAAFRVPAVVIYGGFTSPKVVGYPEQIALVDDGPETPCGNRLACEHCHEALAAIRPADAAQAVNRLLEHASRQVKAQSTD